MSHSVVRRHNFPPSITNKKAYRRRKSVALAQLAEYRFETRSWENCLPLLIISTVVATRGVHGGFLVHATERDENSCQKYRNVPTPSASSLCSSVARWPSNRLLLNTLTRFCYEQISVLSLCGVNANLQPMIADVCRSVMLHRIPNEDEFWEVFRDVTRKLAARCRRVRHSKKTRCEGREALRINDCVSERGSVSTDSLRSVEAPHMGASLKSSISVAAP